QTRCIKPPMQLPDGKFICPTSTKKYNILGQVVAAKDENGFVTRFSYNSYGDPIRIIHPDKSVERRIYYLCGWLKQKWLPDNSSVYYSYDPKGRILKEIYLDSKGKLLKEEHYGYKGPLLQYKKDAMGVITTYHYDGAGRKIEESDHTKTTRYEYDGLGR